MSDFTAYVPPFVRASRDTRMPPGAGRDRDDLDFDLDDDAGLAGRHDHDTEVDAKADDAVPAVLREGLPPSYRMRAEPHYVEALVDRSLAAFDPVAPVGVAPSPLPPPATAGAAIDRGASISAGALVAAASSMAEAFDSIQASLRDVPLRGRPLRDRVAIELARAEATRGRWLADAALVMQVEPLPALDEVDLLRLLDGVLDAHGPENRLSGGAVAMSVPAGACPVFGDERMLTTALGAMLAAIRTLIEERGDARKVRVTLGPRGEAATRTIEVTQTAVRLPSSAYGRLFDADWADHPAGASGALLLAAARKIALAHGGSLDVGPVDGGGCRLVLSVPAAD